MDNPFDNPFDENRIKRVNGNNKDTESIEMNHLGKDVGKNEKKPLYQLFPSKTKFYFCGRLMTGPDVYQFLIAFFMLFIPSLLWFIFVGPYLWTKSPAYPIVYAIIFIAANTFQFITCYVDAGILPRNPEPKKKPPQTKDQEVKETKFKLRYCSTCSIYRPPRATHCGVCDNCVERFDHHCPWIGNCVGRKNYRFFLAYVTTVPIAALFVISTSVYKMVALANEYYTGSGSEALWEACRQCYFCPVLVVFPLAPLALVGALATYHYYLVSIDETTNEKIKNTYHNIDNPNNRGFLGNCFYFWFGPRYISYFDFRKKVTVGKEFDRKFAVL
eukprot:TRINITY_DN15280_c0_g1_i1.p1 TRINITY_DN15280_c0_g1~~TRINITY_DN15280_c0_g1_i1.p1  ORF type:complete len:330 (-),score=48.79 TRINITY_DN15280_c0_g1_i1:8-997(-)